MNQQLRDKFLFNLNVEAKLIGALVEMGNLKWVPHEYKQDIDNYREPYQRRFMALTNKLNDQEWSRESATAADLVELSKQFADLKVRLATMRRRIKRYQDNFSSPSMSFDVVRMLEEDVVQSLQAKPNAGAQAKLDLAAVYLEIFKHTGDATAIRSAAAHLKTAQQICLGEVSLITQE